MRTIAMLLLLVLPSLAIAAPGACKTRTASAEEHVYHATATVQCKSGEYLQNWGFTTSQDDANLVRAELLIGKKNIPTGVTVRVDDGFAYTLTVTAICCKK
jgi:hypothetical protein